MENEYRPNVSHIGDLAHSPPDDILLVENNEDYVRACYAMANRDKSGTGLKIWVRSKSHFAWLKDFSGQIGCPAIFDEKTSPAGFGRKVECPPARLADGFRCYRPGTLGAGCRCQGKCQFRGSDSRAFPGTRFQAGPTERRAPCGCCNGSRRRQGEGRVQEIRRSGALSSHQMRKVGRQERRNLDQWHLRKLVGTTGGKSGGGSAFGPGCIPIQKSCWNTCLPRSKRRL